MSILKTKFAAARAKELRSTSTDAERRLWARLRNRQLLGAKFVRQQPVGPYIVDFACRERDLVVELDGGQHGHDSEISRDNERTQGIAAHGYSLLRFWNNDVMTNLDGVLRVIADGLEKAPSPGLRFATSDLSPQGRGVEGPVQTGKQT